MSKVRLGEFVARVSIIMIPALAACTVTADDHLLGTANEVSSDANEPDRAPLGVGGSDQGSPGGGEGTPSTDPPSAETPDSTDPSDPSNPPDTSATPSPAPRPVPYRGVNLSGAEFGSALPGRYGTDYTFPTSSEVDYYMGKGMNTFRVGFRWERLQHSAYGAFDDDYFTRLDNLVRYATAKGATVILNPANFARYYGETVGSSKVPNAVFADFWGKLSGRYKADANVMFNLVNEPHSMPTEQWVGAANAAIKAIREAGANNVIVVPGNSWTGAHSWYSSSYGTPNAKAMLDIVDSKDNLFFEAHQYFDSDSSGSSGTCVSRTIGSERMKGFVGWLREHKKKGFLGEFAAADNSTCNAAVKDMLDYLHANADVIVGWAWWGGGPWWHEYHFTLHPKDGKDRPQMALLEPYLD